MNYMQCIVVSASNDQIKPIRCRHLTTVFFPWFGVLFAGYFLVEILTWLRRFRKILKLSTGKIQLDFELR